MACDPQTLADEAAPYQGFSIAQAGAVTVPLSADWMEEGLGYNTAACAVTLTVTIVAGDTFDCYPVIEVVDYDLKGGTGFNGSWVVRSNYLGIQALDTFENYAVQSPVTATLNSGYGFNEAWTIRDI